jgi:hypothetical protein
MVFRPGSKRSAPDAAGGAQARPVPLTGRLSTMVSATLARGPVQMRRRKVIGGMSNGSTQRRTTCREHRSAGTPLRSWGHFPGRWRENRAPTCRNRVSRVLVTTPDTLEPSQSRAKPLLALSLLFGAQHERRSPWREAHHLTRSRTSSTAETRLSACRSARPLFRLPGPSCRGRRGGKRHSAPRR